MNGEIHNRPAQDLLDSIQDETVDMVYTDPPFGTGDVQAMDRRKSGEIVSKMSYSDKHEDYAYFLMHTLVSLHRVLKPTGTMYLHLDPRWSHYAKVMCDEVFGRDNFLNEVIWSYNFGGRGKDRWPQKHDVILVYTKQQGKHVFNWEDIDRVPYAAPELQYVGRSREDAEKRIAEGQVPTDVWNMSIVGTASKERLGYPNQKPLKLVKRCIVASSNLGDLVLDPFAGSGTTAAAALTCGRRFLTTDVNQEAIDVMRRRFGENSNVVFVDS